MRRRLTYAVLAAAALCAMYGFVDQRLFAQAIWLPEGLARFAVYTAIYWAVAVVFLPTRPAWFVPCVAAFVFVYSTWWCSLHFHPLAPLAVIYFLGSCWMVGRFFARDVIRVDRRTGDMGFRDFDCGAFRSQPSDGLRGRVRHCRTSRVPPRVKVTLDLARNSCCGWEYAARATGWSRSGRKSARTDSPCTWRFPL